MGGEKIQETSISSIDSALGMLGEQTKTTFQYFEGTFQTAETIENLDPNNTQGCCSVIESAILNNPKTAHLFG